MNIELKPCPFCGGEAEMMGDQYPYVECQECAGGFTANHSYDADEGDAANKWNARSAAGRNLKPIAESKVRQLGGDVCGVLVRTEDGVMAVSEHGRCTRLDAAVMGPEPIIPSERFTVEPHGSGYAIYRGRDADHHGENLGHLTECMLDLPKMLERALNAQERPEYTVDREFLVQLLTDRQKRIDELEKQVAESARAQGGQGAEAVKWSDPVVDPIVSKLYRKFKEWNRQGFGADDVTWCEVRGYVAELLNAQPKPAVPEGWLVRRVDDRITVQHPDIGGYCASKDGNDHSAIAPVILYHFASALLSTPTTTQPAVEKLRCQQCGNMEPFHATGCETEYGNYAPTTPQADGWKVKFMQIMGEIYSDLDDEHEDPIPSDLWDLWRDLRAATQPPAGQEGA